MKPQFHWLISIVLLTGCSEQERRSGPPTVLPGQGISGVATVDMSLRQIRSAVDDLTVKPYPAAGLPWQKNSIGDKLRLPWEKPQNLTAVSRSLGLALSTDREDTPVQQLTFFSDPEPLMVDSNTWFTGQLSGGISFADRRRVPRQEIIAVFGEPMLRRAAYDSNAWQLVKDGTSLGVTHSNGIENLWYPTDGISFCLRDGRVISFQVCKATAAGGKR